MVFQYLQEFLFAEHLCIFRVFFENILNIDGVLLQEKLKEYVGHTPLQVVAGAILGIGLALVISAYY